MVIVADVSGSLHSLNEPSLLAGREGAIRIQKAVQLDGLGDEPCPAGLMAGPEPGTIVAVEVLIEQYVVAPVRVGLELLCAAVDGSPAVFVAGEYPGEPVGDLLAHLEKIHHLP